jgi:hypothetical protein
LAHHKYEFGDAESAMTRLQLSDGEIAFVAARIRAFDSESSERLRWLSPYVTQFEALPLYIGWLETVGLRPDGSVLRWSTEGEYEGWRAVDDPLLLRASLVEGAKRYPALEPLIPTRPEGARTCETCGGLGHIPQIPQVICACGGVGWRDDAGRD